MMMFALPSAASDASVLVQFGHEWPVLKCGVLRAQIAQRPARDFFWDGQLAVRISSAAVSLAQLLLATGAAADRWSGADA